MTDHIQDEFEQDESESEEKDDDVDRAPQPGNTPAPDEPPFGSGAITGRDTEDE